MLRDFVYSDVSDQDVNHHLRSVNQLKWKTKRERFGLSEGRNTDFFKFFFFLLGSGKPLNC